MLPLETKQSGGKLFHHSDIRGGESFWWKYPAADATARRIKKK